MAGIVRRIDELGRIVIPKEIRRTMVIRDGEQLEMAQISPTEILVKKFSQLGNLNKLAAGYCRVLRDLTQKKVLIVDTTKVIAEGGLGKEIVEELISNKLYNIILERNNYRTTKSINLLKSDTEDYGTVNIFPIIADGEVCGAVVMIGEITSDNYIAARAVIGCATMQLE